MRRNDGPWPRVLLADDDPDMLQVIEWLLETDYPGAVVRTVQDGRRAYEEMVDFRPHLLVTDMRMPRYDGAFLCRMIRNTQELSATRILAVTAYADSDTTKELFNSGAVEILIKPFDPVELRRAMRRLLGTGRSRARSQAPLGL